MKNEMCNRHSDLHLDALACPAPKSIIILFTVSASLSFSLSLFFQSTRITRGSGCVCMCPANIFIIRFSARRHVINDCCLSFAVFFFAVSHCPFAQRSRRAYQKKIYTETVLGPNFVQIILRESSENPFSYRRRLWLVHMHRLLFQHQQNNIMIPRRAATSYIADCRHTGHTHSQHFIMKCFVLLFFL